MKRLVVDNIQLYTEHSDYKSQNGFEAVKRLQQNRKLKLIRGIITNDTQWMMKILPKIAEYFGLARKDVLRRWVQEYGTSELFAQRSIRQ